MQLDITHQGVTITQQEYLRGQTNAEGYPKVVVSQRGDQIYIDIPPTHWYVITQNDDGTSQGQLVPMQ